MRSIFECPVRSKPSGALIGLRFDSSGIGFSEIVGLFFRRTGNFPPRDDTFLLQGVRGLRAPAGYSGG